MTRTSSHSRSVDPGLALSLAPTITAAGGAPRFGFVTFAGRRFYFPGIITVWHHEPGGKDSGEVCKHWRTNRDGKRVPDRSWRWHVHHWHIQVRPLQALRRWALTRCAWCGGPSRKGDAVNVSHSWDGPRGRWWQGEPGLYHHWCSSAKTAWNTCTCDQPDLGSHLSGQPRDYGPCTRCGRFRKWRLDHWEAEQAEGWREDVPRGTHPTRAAYERAVARYQAAKTAGAAS